MVMRGHVSESFRRGVLRILGTILGATLAVGIAPFVAERPFGIGDLLAADAEDATAAFGPDHHVGDLDQPVLVRFGVGLLRLRGQQRRRLGRAVEHVLGVPDGVARLGRGS